MKHGIKRSFELSKIISTHRGLNMDEGTNSSSNYCHTIQITVPRPKEFQHSSNFPSMADRERYLYQPLSTRASVMTRKSFAFRRGINDYVERL